MADSESRKGLASYNIAWASPSANSLGSMPIGNGDIGLNVWVEPSGDLVFFIGKTDAWDENVRLLKLGKIRVKLTPALVTTETFRQELKLHEGVIEISSARVKIRVWVDANHPVIHVNMSSSTDQPIEAEASFELWRMTKRSLGLLKAAEETSILQQATHPCRPSPIPIPSWARPRNTSAGITATWFHHGWRA